MPFLGQRQQQFELVDQVRPFPINQQFPATHNMLAGCPLSKAAASKTLCAIDLYKFRISRFDIGIDRNSVSPHGTALLIFTSIPTHNRRLISL
jgi:hypothetical protein